METFSIQDVSSDYYLIIQYSRILTLITKANLMYKDKITS